MLLKFKRNQGKIHRALLLSLFLSACGSTSEPVPSDIPESPTAEINRILTLAERSSGLDAAVLIVEAAERFAIEGLIDDAASALNQISNADALSSQLLPPQLLPPQLRLRYATTQARIASARGDEAAAIRWLTGSLVNPTELTRDSLATYYGFLGELYQTSDRQPEAVRAYAEATSTLQSAASSDVFDRIWLALGDLEDTELQELANSTPSYELRGWIELARVYRNDDFSIRSQLDAVAQWQSIWSSHSAARRLPQALADLQSIWSTRPRHIALILPTQQQSGITIQEGFFSAYYEALSSIREVPRISVYDSSNVEDVSDVYDRAVQSEADLIIGPLDKALVNQLASRDSLPVTTLALNYPDAANRIPANLYQFGLAPEDEIDQLANLAWRAGHRNAAVVTPQSADYLRLQDEFSATWQRLGGRLVSATTFSDTTDYSETVKRLMAIDASEARASRLLDLLPRNSIEFTPRPRQDIDFIFLIANPRQGRLIKPTLAFYFAENVPVYSMPSIYEGVLNPSEDRDLNDIWFADAPWLLQSAGRLKQDVSANLRPASGQLQRLRALGIDSFRLYARLGQLSTGQLTQLTGATGLLTMEQNQRIRRHLNVAKFVNGEALRQPVNIGSSDW